MRPINPAPSNSKGMSKGMVAETGRLLFVSGQVPRTSDGELVGPGITEQATQVFENIRAVLEEAGASFDDVVKLTIFLCPFSQENRLAYREVRDRYINADCPPTSSMVGISALVEPEFLLEVEAIAELPAQ